MNFLIHTIFARLLDLIFPERCVGCGKNGEAFCLDCKNKTRREIMGKNSILFLDKLYYWGIYEDKLLQSALKRFKYHGAYSLAHPLSDMLKDLVTPHLSSFETDTLVIPIPAHEKRKKMRGYNQAELLAHSFSKKVALPMNSEILQKSINTISQTSLSGEERIFNVKNSFSVIQPQIVKNKKIILVDDITTTGATLSEAARILKEAGALEVTGLVVAK